MNNSEYYLNQGRNCPQIPSRYDNFLDRNNYLSEYNSDQEKQIIRDNLGISELLDILNNKIDNKVIEQGNIAWDLQPTEGNTTHVLSSDALYKTLLKYALKEEVDNNIQLLWTNLNQKINNIYTTLRSLDLKIESFLQSSAGDGTALAGDFGSSEYSGINQKTITEAINKIWDTLGEISGKNYQGIIFEVSPEYFVGEKGNIHIKASTEDTTGIFEKLQIYSNGELVVETENTNYFEYDFEITETSVIMCKAKILGIEYTQMKTITHYNSFWIGAGTSYEDAMTLNNIVPITNGLKGSYNITFNQGDYLFIIIGDSLREEFARADMNGMEIPFTEREISIDENTYKIFTSQNPYNSGTYNIDINS